MAIQPIQPTVPEKGQYNVQNKRNVSFSGAGVNPVITVMDAIDRGGFAASFILQDFLGMAAPRIGTGIFRNSDKTGQLNWDFAKKEGIREILSGPSAFLIPLGMMFGIKKFAGAANNVPVDYINGLGETFSKFASENRGVLADPKLAKEGFYKEAFKNILSTSTNNGLKGEKLEKTAQDFAKRLIEAENAPSKGFIKNLTGKKVAGSSQDLIQQLTDDFVKLRKHFLGSKEDKLIAKFTAGDGKLATSLKSLFGHMNDYSNDIIKSVNKKLTPELNLEQFIKDFGRKRSGSRILSNASMFLTVVGFFTIIPKLYNRATKGKDPGLAGLVPQEEQNNNGQVSFTGGINGAQRLLAKTSDTVMGSKTLKGLSDTFEFNGASMSMPAMLTLLFGFCLPPRLVNAQSNTDRKEILFRDVLSFSSILFGAKALTRVFSDAFAKYSGLALNVKPADHDKSLFKKIWHYIYPSGGVQVLDSERIIANYSDVASNKHGINDLFDFVNKNGGNVGKMLNLDPEIKAAATEILKEEPNKNMTMSFIKKQFNKAKGTPAYNRMIKLLEDQGNSLVKKAKTYNSAFGFASTVLLVPALMIWISKHCENMTKKRIEAEAKARQKEVVPDIIRVNHPTMAGFLNK